MRLASLSSPLLLASLVAFVVAPIACATAVRDETSSGSGGDGPTGSGGSGGQTGGAGGQGGQGATGGAGGGSEIDAGPDAMPDMACMGKPDFAACEDGLFCTQNDVCIGGKCTAGPSKICPSNGNACQIGSCNEATNACELAPVNNGGACEDGNPCTDLGTCSNGTCLPGPTKDCSFLNGTCSIGVCDPVKGCVAMPQNDGSFCDDNKFCTVNDACMAGACVGEPNPCGAPNDVCKIAACDEINKTCTAVPGNNGAACNDGNACTTGETCSNGTCVGGMPANQGLSCDDKNACTVGESCTNGTCGGGNPVLACASGDGCCPAGCDFLSDSDCKQLRVGFMTGFFYVDDLRNYLASQPFIQSAAQESDCSVASLQKYDVVFIHGNMDCFDPNAFNTYVQNGGGIIGTPWIHNNNGGLDCLPVSGSMISSYYSDPLDVTVTNPGDVLLNGVVFQNGNMVGWEDWSFALKPGASSSVIWKNDTKKLAVAKWQYGQGRAVYLDFHYFTSDCTNASNYQWGKQLGYNAALWAGKAL